MGCCAGRQYLPGVVGSSPARGWSLRDLHTGRSAFKLFRLGTLVATSSAPTYLRPESGLRRCRDTCVFSGEAADSRASRDAAIPAHSRQLLILRCERRIARRAPDPTGGICASETFGAGGQTPQLPARGGSGHPRSFKYFPGKTPDALA